MTTIDKRASYIWVYAQSQATTMSSLRLSYSTLPFRVLLLLSVSWLTSADTHEDFLQCLSLYSQNSTSISEVIYTPRNPSYSSVLQSTLQNLRFNTTSTPKPQVIVTPTDVFQIQSTIYCSRKHNMQVRIRSGGHDFEGLSYASISSTSPFAIIDLINLRAINVDVANKVAWVQAGATLGEVYYRIAEKSRTLAFPAGVCPTVAVGGHFSGGGYGSLLRKYGLATDNIIDAHLVDANGRTLDRSSMGEGLFWAIRGGGGNTFGIVIAWKIKLVQVPPTVTLFSVARYLEDNATQLVHRWQYVAHKLPEELLLSAILFKHDSTQTRIPTIGATFLAVFLGSTNQLLPLMQERFPELNVTEEDCNEMSWIESVLFVAGFPSNAPLEVLLDRTAYTKIIFKAKSDYVKEPIPENAFEEIWKRFQDAEWAELFFIPYGGKMSEISESSVPYPHRAGNLYKILYAVSPGDEGNEGTERHLRWIRRLYSYMAPYVSKNPREAYVNYRDLDLGMNQEHGHASYEQASIWGKKYFKNNFQKLVQVKTAVDPTNFFRNEQSIPPLYGGD